MKKTRPLQIYSTMKIEKGAAHDQASMFTVPQGQAMPVMRGPDQRAHCPTCGQHAGAGTPAIPMNAEHTNIMQAGQFGSAIGDCAIKHVRAILDVACPLDADFELRVAGRTMFRKPLSEVIAGFDVYEPDLMYARAQQVRDLPMRDLPVLVGRTDCFEGRLYLHRPAEADVFVRVEFDADVAIHE